MEVNERVGMIVVSMVLFGSLLLDGCKSQAPPPPPAVPEVATVTVQQQRVLLTDELPGRASPYRVAEIRPQVSGIIQRRLFEEGADVKADDVLYQIDPAPFQAAYDNAAANLAVMRKSADRARAALEVEYRGRQTAAGHPGPRPDERRTLRGPVQGPGRLCQPARPGRDRCRSGRSHPSDYRGAGGERPPSGGRGRGGHPAGGGGAQHGPDQSGIHPGHRTHLRPHRQIQRDGWRPGDGVSGHEPWQAFNNWIPFMWMCPNPPPNCCA